MFIKDRCRVLAVVAAVMFLFGCAANGGVTTVKVPTADSTPPKVELKVHNDNYSSATITPQTGPVSHTFSVSDQLVVDAHGFDPDSGVRNVKILGDYSYSCINPFDQFGSENIGKTYFPDFGIDVEGLSFPTVKPGTVVLVNLYNNTTLIFTDYEGCGPGLTVFSGLTIHIRATAVNYLGGEATTSEFTCHVNP
jgi:hypothetical protein